LIVRSTRYLHPIGCDCRSCRYPRPQSKLYEPTMTAATGALLLIASAIGVWRRITGRK